MRSSDSWKTFIASKCSQRLSVLNATDAAGCGFRILFSFVSRKKENPTRTLIININCGPFKEEEIVGGAWFSRLSENPP